MVAWWEALTTFEQILACIALPSTLVLAIQTALLLFGLSDGPEADFDGYGGADFDADFDTDVDEPPDIQHGILSQHDTGLRMFTVRGFVAFFTVFGWGALALSRSGTNTAVAIVAGAILGFCSMLVIALILRFALKLQSDGTLDYKNALGATGNVYIPIPPERAGNGKIAVVIQERLCECEAVTDGDQKIQTGASVVVTGVTGKNTLIVRKKS